MEAFAARQAAAASAAAAARDEALAHQRAHRGDGSDVLAAWHLRQRLEACAARRAEREAREALHRYRGRPFAFIVARERAKLGLQLSQEQRALLSAWSVGDDGVAMQVEWTEVEVEAEVAAALREDDAPQSTAPAPVLAPAIAPIASVDAAASAGDGAGSDARRETGASGFAEEEAAAAAGEVRALQAALRALIAEASVGTGAALSMSELATLIRARLGGAWGTRFEPRFGALFAFLRNCPGLVITGAKWVGVVGGAPPPPTPRAQSAPQPPALSRALVPPAPATEPPVFHASSAPIILSVPPPLAWPHSAAAAAVADISAAPTAPSAPPFTPAPPAPPERARVFELPPATLYLAGSSNARSSEVAAGMHTSGISTSSNPFDSDSDGAVGSGGSGGAGGVEWQKLQAGLAEYARQRERAATQSRRDTTARESGRSGLFGVGNVSDVGGGSAGGRPPQPALQHRTTSTTTSALSFEGSTYFETTASAPAASAPLSARDLWPAPIPSSVVSFTSSTSAGAQAVDVPIRGYDARVHAPAPVPLAAPYISPYAQAELLRTQPPPLPPPRLAAPARLASRTAYQAIAPASAGRGGERGGGCDYGSQSSSARTPVPQRRAGAGSSTVDIVPVAAAGDASMTWADFNLLLRPVLARGFTLIKHGRQGDGHVREFWLDGALTRLFWSTEQFWANLNTGERHIDLADVVAVYDGAATDLLRRKIARHEIAALHVSRLFSLITAKRTLDLQANSPDAKDVLVRAFAFLLRDMHRGGDIGVERAY